MPVDVTWSCPSLDIDSRTTELPCWAAHRDAWYEVASKVVEDAFEKDSRLFQYDIFYIDPSSGLVEITIHDPAAVAGVYAVQVKTMARVISVKARAENQP